MIRLLQRRLIIPSGDTGKFTVPVLANTEGEGIAVFSIIDPITYKIIFQKNIVAEDGVLTIEFTHAETLSLPIGRYVWDIKYYVNPVYEDGQVVDGSEVNSYYAGFNLPVCEIKRSSDKMDTYTTTPAIRW